jgi:hypothetical protein
MVPFIIFLITVLQLVLAGLSYVQEWREVFNIVFVHLSPVMVFFGGLESIMKFTGEFSYFFFPALAYCVVKYILLAIALKNDELGFFNVGALLLEILYVAGSSFYVVYYSYL